jgi:dCMP deaminase
MRISRDEWGLRLAETTALRGTCLRRQVGCVLVDSAGRVLATGYNGRERGRKHCAEVGEYLETVYPYACPAAWVSSGSDLDACDAIHAEQNACLQCRDPDAIHTCYVTVSPCVSCLKLLLNTGCRRVVFREAYAQDASALWAPREWVCLLKET